MSDFYSVDRICDAIRDHGRPSMSLREHYAGLAMAALASRTDLAPGPFPNMSALIAHFATDYADALIAKLAEKPTEAKP